MAVGLLLFGCASTGQLANRAQGLTPGVTSREQVIELLGQPVETQKLGESSEVLIYVEETRRTGRGALLGASILSAIVLVPAIILAPVTLGASLLLIPMAAGVGGVTGGLGGAAVKRADTRLEIYLDDNGIVQKHTFASMSGDVHVVQSSAEK